eukprot:CAMPEP_0203816694 /NCGR_PEP_ID=MMETSP0115-20131106/17641_1 /ASSEMBLY_ACC=CAM_ASM_000227 /TAXON_ID=33651 /ORGANISM="Bicosoecid sp, Strain ms1" /LENGTH=160 /DNA_ID=CAMNT_0050725603 /DNA_START=110 /DNA_END=592 /DNA_ORIENTATION=+
MMSAWHACKGRHHNAPPAPPRRASPLSIFASEPDRDAAIVSSQPPRNLPLIHTLGTVRWPVCLARASWMAPPFFTRSNSSTTGVPNLASSAFAFLQYPQVVLLKTTILLSGFVVIRATTSAMMEGDAALCLRRVDLTSKESACEGTLRPAPHVRRATRAV